MQIRSLRALISPESIPKYPPFLLVPHFSERKQGYANFFLLKIGGHLGFRRCLLLEDADENLKAPIQAWAVEH